MAQYANNLIRIIMHMNKAFEMRDKYAEKQGGAFTNKSYLKCLLS